MPGIDKLPSGSYRVRITYKDASGKWRQKSFVAAEKQEALRQAYAFEPKEISRCIEDALRAYIASREPILSPSTIRGYISILDNLKARHSAFCALTEPSREEAQALVNDLAAEMTPKAVRNYTGLISSAVKFSGGTFPPVVYPRSERHSDYIPDEKDIAQIVEAVRGSKMELPVALGIMGLRRSEIAAITPEDLDGNRLHIHSALVVGPDNEVIRKGTKTSGSTRTIIVPDHVADLIREGPVEISLQQIGKRFAKIVSDLGIKMRFHDLRHYFVSYCHNVLRLSDAQIMKLGGWSTDTIMKRHYRQSMKDEETAQAVADALSVTISVTHKKNRLK